MEILESNQGVRRPTLHRSENWGLHRQGVQDEARHQEKIEEAIRGDLAGAVSS